MKPLECIQFIVEALVCSEFNVIRIFSFYKGIKGIPKHLNKWFENLTII